MLIIRHRKDIIVLPDEGYLIYALIPFFPIHRCICIVHDYRDPLATNTNPPFFKKWYYQATNKGFTRLKKSARVVSVSDFTTDTLQQNFPEMDGKITTLVVSAQSLNIPPVKTLTQTLMETDSGGKAIRPV